jgi:hypothetical protein
MENNSYQDCKQFIFNKLSKVTPPLPKTKIADEIESFRLVIGAVGPDLIKSILSVDHFESLENSDWERMTREFEMHFDVEMKLGILVQGNDQQTRDTSWWTSVYKQKAENYYWDRLKIFLAKSLPPSVVATIDRDTDIVMNNLENPAINEFSRYGMVVGHVQSGKTGNYSTLICKAADAGYKFIVVIAGGINNLRDQTQERLNESFIGQTKGAQVGAGIGNTRKESMPYSLTTIERDFNKQDADRLAQGLNFDNISVPVLLVIKKNTRTFANVIEWLEKQYKGNRINHAMLVIDDESDYGSINTKEENEPTAINAKLRKLLSLFQKYAYVAYTATPYANIFIDHKATQNEVGDDLFPKDFIYALDAPSNYFGARKIFIDNKDFHLIPVQDYEESLPYSHQKNHKLEVLPKSLNDAILLFVLNIAIRRLRRQVDEHNSMLIHATRFTDVHKAISVHVESYLKMIRQQVMAYASLSDAEIQSPLLRDMHAIQVKYLSTMEFPWEDILIQLPSYIETIVVREVHQQTSVPLEYRKDIVTNAIVIGGASLARGFTVVGLSVSYFLRNTIFYDTLMQMGRWFGYRPGYEDLCRIFMPEERIGDFAEIIDATDDLISTLKLMAELKRTPNDFGLAVQRNPDSALQITARNKQKNIHHFLFDMQLDGTLKETSYLSKDEMDIKHNMELVGNLVSKMPILDENEETKIWKHVDKSLIRTFVSNFKLISRDTLGLSSRMPIRFILQYIEERHTTWDVALYSGSGVLFPMGEVKIKKQKRQLKVNSWGAYEVQNRQVSSGNSENVTIEDSYERSRIGDNRKLARASADRPRPLLMLHILQSDTVESIAAFGISFSGDAASTNPPVQLLINTVYVQNLAEALKYDTDGDD